MGSSREAGSGRNGVRHPVGSIGPGQRMDGPMRAIRVRFMPAEEHGSWPEGNALSASGSGIMSRGGAERLLDCMCSTQVNSSNQGRGAARPKGGRRAPLGVACTARRHEAATGCRRIGSCRGSRRNEPCGTGVRQLCLLDVGPYISEHRTHDALGEYGFCIV